MPELQSDGAATGWYGAPCPDFDAATIATTHELLPADARAGSGVARRPRTRTQRIVEDLTRPRPTRWPTTSSCARTPTAPAPLHVPMAGGRARRGRVASRRPRPDAVPEDSEPDRVRARRADPEVERRKRDRAPARLRRPADAGSATRWPTRSTVPPACERVRRGTAVVLVDEFQDTDPVQWDILRRAFHGNATLVLIGDPKQAIYAFRGADVVTYLRRGREADARATLATNWRSDRPLRRRLARLFGGAALGDERIVVQRRGQRAPDRRLAARMPVRPCGSGSPPERGAQARRRRCSGTAVEADLVADVAAAGVAALLRGGLRLAPAGRRARRPVEPSDIAILVRKNKPASPSGTL